MIFKCRKCEKELDRNKKNFKPCKGARDGLAKTCRRCAVPSTARSYEEKFWDKINVRGQHECWEWRGGLTKDGYGKAAMDKKRVMAHRVAYLFSKGDPSNILVCHTCDNPKCCNPEHLFPGDHQINQADKVAKGRQAQGVRCGMSKLTPEVIGNIRERHANGEPYADIGRSVGIDRTHVQNIVLRRNWKSVA